MIKNVYSPILECYFKRAIDSFYSCIELEENSCLFKEIAISASDVQLERDSIKFLYNVMRSKHHVIEVSLNLLSKESNVGYYTLILNEENQALDDYLVFKTRNVNTFEY
ncbi:hypothetical protein [Sphingobacterium sp. BIGb0165]|uniref:hypothetical protein n=1 Tax=Sphingobacterium sp. BIGb0165 TaxID=2940615 RepID=UPI0021682FB5|nr:hypothetical protein [Sphingobacterium sp. BIGb0165]MCS4225785.1 hypothetical protein [Sphingobacterium sp. BIGb0165]